MSPRDYRLYHFTSELSFLAQILEKGFWPRYCPEDFSWTVGGRPLYLMIPMVSFCDIPLGMAAEHKAAYGDFMVGLNKDWGKQAKVTPLLYIYDGSPIAEHVAKYGRALLAGQLTPDKLGDLLPLVPYMKPVTGFFPGKKYTHHTTECKDFDEEMEWRYVPHELLHTIYTEDIFEDDAFKRKQQRNETSLNRRLTFSADDVELIVVRTEEDRTELARRFPDFAGKIKVWGEIEFFPEATS
jgi:hypothetical protein